MAENKDVSFSLDLENQWCMTFCPYTYVFIALYFSAWIS